MQNNNPQEHGSPDDTERKTRRDLRALIDSCLVMAGDSAVTAEQQSELLEKAQKMQKGLDSMVDVAFHKRTEVFNHLGEELTGLNQEVQEKNADLNSQRDKLKAVSDVLALADKCIGTLSKFGLLVL